MLQSQVKTAKKVKTPHFEVKPDVNPTAAAADRWDAYLDGKYIGSFFGKERAEQMLKTWEESNLKREGGRA